MTLSFALLLINVGVKSIRPFVMAYTILNSFKCRTLTFSCQQKHYSFEIQCIILSFVILFHISLFCMYAIMIFISQFLIPCSSCYAGLEKTAFNHVHISLVHDSIYCLKKIICNFCFCKIMIKRIFKRQKWFAIREGYKEIKI